MSNWIKVEDQLPDLHNDVLIVRANKKNKNDRQVSVGHYAHLDNNLNKPFVWNRCLVFQEQILIDSDYHVTHWQPFPELPGDEL